MALLYGRTGPLDGGKPTDAEEETPPSARRPRRRDRRVVLRTSSARRSSGDADHSGPSAGGAGGAGAGAGGWRRKLSGGSRTLFGSQAFWLAALVFLFSALWELLKSQQTNVAEKLKNSVFTTVEVRSSQMEYPMILEWMSRQCEERGTRNLALRPITVADEKDSRNRGDDAVRETGPSVLVPGYGVHFFVFKGTRLWIHRQADPSKQHASLSQRLDREHDILTITFFSRKRSVIQDFLTAVGERWSEKVNHTVRILEPDYRAWVLATERARRPLETLYLPPSTKAIVDEVRTFYELRETYRQLGIPWRRGFLFEGPPGTGKTSLVLALAGALNLPVCVLSLRSKHMDDSMLLESVASLPPRCLLLLEDFESCLFDQRKTKNETASAGDRAAFETETGGGVSLGGLLNALDGVASTEGRVLVMTSNDVSRVPLPDALLRPGRIDRRVRFERLTEEQLREMQLSFEKVLRDSLDPVLNKAAASIKADIQKKEEKSPGLSPAAFQEVLLERVYESYANDRTAAATGQ